MPFAAQILAHIRAMFPAIPNVQLNYIIQGSTFPAIVIKITNNFKQVYYPGTVGISNPQLEVAVYSKDKAVIEGITETLGENFTGVSVPLLFSNSRILYDDVFVDAENLIRRELNIELIR